LNGLIHIGLKSYSAGRANEPAAHELSECLKKLGFRTFRLKTGTPMRLDKYTIDWDKFDPQPGDEEPVPFSYRTKKKLENKVVCFIGYTNQQTHDIIRDNLDKSPLYSGKITGIGTRYCPSIEDKVVKFPHHSRHQFFLEPEGVETSEIYINGVSSSLPYETQRAILKSIPGLDRAKILRPAYGIEYDAVAPTQLLPTLETKIIEGLYLAGPPPSGLNFTTLPTSPLYAPSFSKPGGGVWPAGRARSPTYTLPRRSTLMPPQSRVNCPISAPVSPSCFWGA
jgi:tRNA uridine 5-carboxymethylaminomethyl modification enzyme